VAGVMNVAEPVAPAELSYTFSGSTATVKVRNDNYVKNNTGSTRIEILMLHADGSEGVLDGWNVNSTGFHTRQVPASWLANGANTCLIAQASYH
jgi:hypothetical protein